MIKTLMIIFVLFLLFLLRHALVPLFIGIAIAYVLDPYVCWLEKKFSGKRLLCVLLSYLTVFAAAALLIFGFADIIAGKLATGSLQEAIRSLQAYYGEYAGVIRNLSGFSMRGPDLQKVLQSIGGGAIKVLIGLISGLYLLKDKDFFLRLASKGMFLFLPQKVHGILREVLFEINDVISAFLRGVFIDSVIVAFLSSLALASLGIDFAVFIGCFAGIANIIPYFGPILGIVPAALAGMTAGGISKAIAAALALFAVQQIECNFVYPRIIGKSTGLHPLFVLSSVSIAGFFGGLLWMVLAVPIAGIIKVLISKWAEVQ